jgi:alkylation response protein AidB-like acyl-CoA dehydrogenase
MDRRSSSGKARAVNFDFSDDQKQLKDQARKVLADKSSTKAVRAVLETDAVSFDKGLWDSVAELGWLGVSIPEAYGGLGLGKLELCVLAEEMGRALAPIPFNSTLFYFTEALLLAGSEAQKQAVLPNVASGAVIGCFAVSEGPGAPSPASLRCTFDGAMLNGVKIPVTDGDCATHAVVAAKEGSGVSLALVDLSGPGVARETGDNEFVGGSQGARGRYVEQEGHGVPASSADRGSSPSARPDPRSRGRRGHRRPRAEACPRTGGSRQGRWSIQRQRR